jgi:hypothetical protein
MPEQGQHATRRQQLDGAGPSGGRVEPMPGCGREHHVEPGRRREPVEGADHRLHRQRAGGERQHAGHLGVGLEGGDGDAPLGEQPGRLSGSGPDL